MFVFTEPIQEWPIRVPSLAVHRGGRPHLDRVAQLGRGAVGFQVVHV